MKKLLIVYYSWSNGNTERIAKQLQSAAGGDLLRIDTAEPYAGSYDDVVRQGQEEGEGGYEPALELAFYRVLHRLGLPVKVESNTR